MQPAAFAQLQPEAFSQSPRCCQADDTEIFNNLIPNQLNQMSVDAVKTIRLELTLPVGSTTADWSNTAGWK